MLAVCSGPQSDLDCLVVGAVTAVTAAVACGALLASDE